VLERGASLWMEAAYLRASVFGCEAASQPRMVQTYLNKQ
jgi:hypothetical protein